MRYAPWIRLIAWDLFLVLVAFHPLLVGLLTLAWKPRSAADFWTIYLHQLSPSLAGALFYLAAVLPLVRRWPKHPRAVAVALVPVLAVGWPVSAMGDLLARPSFVVAFVVSALAYALRIRLRPGPPRPTSAREGQPPVR